MGVSSSTIIDILNSSFVNIQQIASSSLLLKEISDNLLLLRGNFWFSFSGPIIGAIIAGLIGFLTIIFRDWYEKKKNKSNLVTVEITKNNQDGIFVHRLILENQGNNSAEGTEIELVEIIENGIKKDFVPSPMRWTHINGPTRDIFPHQVAFLDILEAFELNKGQNDYFARLTPLYIDHLTEIVYIKQGETFIKLKVYEKNGQTKNIWFKIDFQSLNHLPSLEIIHEKTA